MTTTPADKETIVEGTTLFVLLVAIGVGALFSALEYTRLDPFFNVFSLGLSLAILFRQVLLERGMRRDSSVKKRSFEVTFGLLSGYDSSEGKLHTKEDAENAIKEWIHIRSKQGLPILTGHLTDVSMIYPIFEGSVSVSVMDEPSAIFNRALTPKFDKDRSDTEVLDTLRSLALHVGQQLGQTRVYYAYLDKQYL